MNLRWGTCGDDRHWCNLVNLVLPLPAKPHGVYIIWHEGKPSRVVRVGQGDVSERLAVHREDKEIKAYQKSGVLRATWATVPAHQRDGVEAYLFKHWKPLVGQRASNAQPIEVNSPWED